MSQIVVRTCLTENKYQKLRVQASLMTAIYRYDVQLLGYKLDDPGFEPRHRQEIYLLSKTSRPAVGPTHAAIQWVPRFFPRGNSGRGVKLTTQPHLVLKFRMSGAMPVIPLYAIMAWTGCSLNFCIAFRHINQHKILHVLWL